jgi:hypothetical protein
VPYYREFYETAQPQAALSTSASLVTDSAIIMGWRSRPPQNALHFEEVDDRTADPYAYFLDSVSRSKYQARLAERGLPEKGIPDRGHSFDLYKHTMHSSLIGWNPTRVSKSFGSGEFSEHHVNPLYAPSINSSPLLPNVPIRPSKTMFPSDGELGTFAQQAYARTAPTASVFDAGQFLGELREGLPRIAVDTVKNGARFYKGLGSDYLNVEFGWKPFLNDLINAARALAGATDMLRRQGERVHRRYGGLPIQSSWELPWSSRSLSNWIGNPGLRSIWNPFPGSPVTGNGPGPDGAQSYFLRTRSVSRWFEGEFSSFYPLGFDPENYFSRLSVLIDGKISPSTLWELSPWSWLVDWYLRIGDSIAANEAAANDLLVMHYGYAMEHTVQTDLISVDATAVRRTKPSTSSYVYWLGLPNKWSIVSKTERKRRLRANPYGFRVGGTSALTQGQLGILGALGLTRLK